jgi:hypothetical protein
MQLPQFSIDFAALCQNGHGNGNIPNRFTVYLGEQGPGSDSQSPSAPPIWGESWYLSYVIQTTNSQHNCLYRPITSAPETSSGQNEEQHTYWNLHPRNSRPEASPVTKLNRELPSANLVDQLLEDYFAIFHPFCPIIDREKFLMAVQMGSVSQTLLRCVLFVSSIHCDLKKLHLLGYSNRVEAEDDLFNNARAAFDSEEESDRLVMLLCSYLLHYWSGSPSKSKDSLWWLAGAIRTAQSMGMHRKIQGSQTSLDRQRTWRRIWWLLYVSSYKVRPRFYIEYHRLTSIVRSGIVKSHFHWESQ